MGKAHMKIVSSHSNHVGKRSAKASTPAFMEEITRAFGKRSSSSGKHPENVYADRLERRQDNGGIPAECNTGGFITSPEADASINALAPVPITWLPACLPSSSSSPSTPVAKVDIYLFAPGLEYPRIQKFVGYPNNGSLSLDFKPRWWDAKKGQQLQLQILPEGVESFLSQLPAGPVFVSTWEDPSSSGDVTDANIAAALDAVDTTKLSLGETTLAPPPEPASLSRGKTAVAVLIPLLILALGIWAGLKYRRKKEAEKRKEWTEKVDKRMSTISADWKSVTAGGAKAAVRSSLAVSRASVAIPNGGAGAGAGAGNGTGQGANPRGSFAFGNIRPASHFGDLDEKAGVLGYDTDGGIDKAQRRPGVGLRNPSGLSGADRTPSSIYTARTSRVSFADQTRPSFDRRTKTFRDSGAYVPPVPSLPGGTTRRPSTDSQTSEQDIAAGHMVSSMTMSPTQHAGAITLTPEDIRARIAAGNAARARGDSTSQGSRGRKSDENRGMSEVDGDVLPALTMMRANDNDEYLLSQNGHGYGHEDPYTGMMSPYAQDSYGPAPPALAYNKPMTSVSVHTSGDGGAVPTPMSPVQAQAQAMSPMMSPVMASMPMQALPASVMSPDEMLRAYAERKKGGGVIGGGATTGSGGVGVGASYPALPQPSVPAPGSRTLFSGMTSTSSGFNHADPPPPKVPQMGFGVGEYDVDFSFGQQTPQTTGDNHHPSNTGSTGHLEAPTSPLGKRKSASNNPYFAHAQMAYEDATAGQEENRAGRGAFRA